MVWDVLTNTWSMTLYLLFFTSFVARGALRAKSSLLVARQDVRFY